MKNLFKSSMLVAMVAAAFVGCSKDATSDIENVIQTNKVRVNFDAKVEDTRATLDPNDDESAFAAAWENGDQVGVRVYSNTFEEVTDSNAVGTWDAGQFSAELDDYGIETYTYSAYYPYSATEIINFGSERVQYGNKYNSAYDIMVAEAFDVTGEIGKFEDGRAIVFPMKRQTAIAYFHFKTEDENIKIEKLVSATLTVGENAKIAAAKFIPDYTDGKENLTDEESNYIKITFDSASAPTAADFTAWFNVLPCTFESMTLELETENYIATISRNAGSTYEAGKLYKVSGELTKWEPKDVEVAPNGTILWSENWDSCENGATPSSNTGGTIVYKDGTIDYAYTDGTSTKTRVYRDENSILAGGTIPELLLAQSGGKWTINNIRTGNCGYATLSFKANKNSETYCKVSSSTTGVSISEPEYTSNGTNKYIVAYTISFASNVRSFDLAFANGGKSGNARIDDIEVVVGKKLQKAISPTNLTIAEKDDAEGSFTATWEDTGVSEYAWRLTTKADNTTNVQSGTTDKTEINVAGLDVNEQYVLYVKSSGDGENYLDSEEASVNVSFSGTSGKQTYTLVTDNTALNAGDKIVIACNSKGFVAGNISSSIMANIESTFSTDKNTITNLGAEAVELTLGGDSSAWTFTNAEGKLLGATAAKKVAWDNGTKTWTITIDKSTGNATIQNGTSTYGKFLYNVNSPRFTTYTSNATTSMLLPQIYRLE